MRRLLYSVYCFIKKKRHLRDGAVQVCKLAGLAFGCIEILGFSPQDLLFFWILYVSSSITAYSSGVVKGLFIEKYIFQCRQLIFCAGWLIKEHI